MSLLTRIEIANLILVESAQMDFSEGFNVITGETGSGKSIVIKAINLVLGAKLSKDDLRSGADFAIIAAKFSVAPNHSVVTELEELGIPFKVSRNQVDILIRRKFDEDVKSSAWINDCSVTLGTLKKVGSLLVHVCAQHQQQKILSKSEHLRQLDQFIDDKSKLVSYQKHYDQAVAILNGMQKTLENHNDYLREQDFLEFRKQELDTLDPSIADFESLKKIATTEVDHQKIQDRLQELNSIVGTSSQADSLSSRLHKALKLIGQIGISDLVNYSETIKLCATELEELDFKIQRLISEDSISELKIQSTQARLDLYYNLMYKLKVSTISELMSLSESIISKFRFIEEAADTINQNLLDFRKIMAPLNKLSATVHKQRQLAGANLEAKVTSEINLLGMKHAEFEVEITPSPIGPVQPFDNLAKIVSESQIASFMTDYAQFTKLNRNGFDQVCFNFSGNLGNPLKPIYQVASGGEMSRIVLALKNCFIPESEPTVMVFDEIDAGISGKVANLVGKKLKQLGDIVQIICISHLPQVAAYANSHFLINKRIVNGKTFSYSKNLDSTGKETEIARMLSGDKVTQQSRTNAKDLVKKASRNQDQL